jgi:putative transposase
MNKYHAMDRRNLEYRIYPKNKHISRLLNQFHISKALHNILLENAKMRYEDEGEGLSRSEMYSFIAQLKEVDTKFKEAHSQVLQNVADRLSKAFKGFYRRLDEKKMGKRLKAGFPRMKRWNRSITYPQSGFKVLSERRLYISKVGNVPIVLHRKLKGKVKIKTMTIKHTRSNRWFVVFSCEIERERSDGTDTRETRQKASGSVGIDVGLTSFYTDDKGNRVENPRHLVKNECRLKRMQRMVSRKVKGSNNRRKAVVRLARQHEKVADQRKDFHHKVSRRLVDTYGLIAVEDLNIKRMMKRMDGGGRGKGGSKGPRLAKHMADAGWGGFLRMLEYKAESANARCIAVDPRGTTQECSECGEKVPKELNERVHRCPYCGLVMPRDQNAAKIILQRALSTVGRTGSQACGDLTTTGRSDRSASRVHEAGTICDKV